MSTQWTVYTDQNQVCLAIDLTMDLCAWVDAGPMRFAPPVFGKLLHLCFSSTIWFHRQVLISQNKLRNILYYLYCRCIFIIHALAFGLLLMKLRRTYQFCLFLFFMLKNVSLTNSFHLLVTFLHWISRPKRKKPNLWCYTWHLLFFRQDYTSILVNNTTVPKILKHA